MRNHEYLGVVVKEEKTKQKEKRERRGEFTLPLSDFVSWVVRAQVKRERKEEERQCSILEGTFLQGRRALVH